MGKNKSASNLVNVIDFNNDRIAFISGSTTLMSISSSGAITTTGVISGSNAASASFALNAGLLNNRNSAEFTSTGSFNAYTSSNDATVTSVAAAALSAVAGVNALAARTSSYTTTSSFNSYTSSNDATVNCVSSTATSALVGVGTLASQTGSYATTGSNTFVGGQYLSSSFNPTGFSTTASLYTDGGLRVSKDAYISGTLYLNNVTVYGTQSVCFITSSQLNISSNIINVNTATPSVRFGGLSVYDSGSTGLTGSILWDSQDNQWIYSNPSGSTYDSAMFLVGPRNTGTLGGEVGIECNFLSKGNGMHHMTSSGIFEDGSRTCFYGNSFVSSSGAACFSGTVCAPAFVSSGIVCSSGRITTSASGNQALFATIDTQVGGATVYLNSAFSGAGTPAVQVETNHPLLFATNNTTRLTIGNTGIACFACQVCTPILLASSYFISSPNTTVSGQGPLDWVYLGAADSAASRATAVQIGDVSGAKYAILGGSFDLTFVKHVCNTNTWATAFTIQGNSTNNNVPDVTFNNNVGIGIFSPGARLDVLSTLNVQATGNSDVPYINFSNNGRSFDWGRVGGLLQGDGDGALYFSTKLGGGITEKLRITSAGIACFNNTVCSPYFVGGTILSTGTITANQGVITNISGLNIGGYNHYTQTVSGAMGIIGHNVRADGSIANQVNVVNSSWISSMIKLYYNEGITFHTSNTMYSAGAIYPMGDTERMRITSGGRVGIGTTTPCTALSVNSGISVSTANAISIMQNTNGANKDAAAFGVSINNGGESTNAADLFISTATGGALCERIRITSAGNIGINRTDPPVIFSIGQAFANTYSIHRGTSSITSSSCTTLFTVCVPLHHSANVEVHAFEDWGGHSSIFYSGKWVISNSETFYNTPGCFQLYSPINNSYNGDCFMATWGLAACNSSPAGAFLFRMRTNNGSTSVRFVATIMGNTVWIG